MKIQRIVLISILVLLAVLPFVVRHYRAKMTREIVSERPVYIPIEEVLPVHEQRIKDRIALLKKQSLDETFVELLEDQQYFYPGYRPPISGGNEEGSAYPQDMERLVSTRSFLKVFQEFDALPQEQVVGKAHTLCERAIKDFSAVLEANARHHEGMPIVRPQSDQTSLMGAKLMLCTSIILAARAGEYELLINQIDEAHRVTSVCVDRIQKSGADPGIRLFAHSLVSLEDDCILTALMHALKRARIADIPFEESFSKKSIPLYRWDASLTHYDFEVGRTKALNPKDALEQFVVYAFTGKDRFDRQKRKLVIDSLKDRLSK